MTLTFITDQAVILGTAVSTDLTPFTVVRIVAKGDVQKAFAAASPADRQAIIEFTEASINKECGRGRHWFLLSRKIGLRALHAGYGLNPPGLTMDTFREAIGLLGPTLSGKPLASGGSKPKGPPKPLRRGNNA